jgi:hypothetical protein
MKEEFPVRLEKRRDGKNRKKVEGNIATKIVCLGGAIAVEASEMKGEKWQNDVPPSFTMIMRAKIAAYIINGKRIVVEPAVYGCVCGKRDNFGRKIPEKLKWFRETKYANT